MNSVETNSESPSFASTLRRAPSRCAKRRYILAKYIACPLSRACSSRELVSVKRTAARAASEYRVIHAVGFVLPTTISVVAPEIADQRDWLVRLLLALRPSY